MPSIHQLAVAALACTFSLSGFAEAPVDHSAHHAAASASAAAVASAASSPGARTAQMEDHMKKMREMHDKMTSAKTPEERSALMAEHMKLMQEGMAMMGGMGPGAASGSMGKGGMRGHGSKTDDMGMHHELMEKRMDMMQSMMQMMLDRLPATPAKP